MNKNPFPIGDYIQVQPYEFEVSIIIGAEKTPPRRCQHLGHHKALVVGYEQVGVNGEEVTLVEVRFGNHFDWVPLEVCKEYESENSK